MHKFKFLRKNKIIIINNIHNFRTKTSLDGLEIAEEVILDLSICAGMELQLEEFELFEFVRLDNGEVTHAGWTSAREVEEEAEPG